MLVTRICSPSYRIFLPCPVRSATMPSSIVSVSCAAYSIGELAFASPLIALTQFISWLQGMRAKVLGTSEASSVRDTGKRRGFDP